MKRGRKSTSWSIDPDRLKARCVLEGYTLKEVSVMTNHCPSWLTMCLYQGRMSEEGIRQLEELGIRRRSYVIRKID